MRSWIIPPFDPSEVSRAFHGKDAFVRRERREGGEEGEKEEGHTGTDAEIGEGRHVNHAFDQGGKLLKVLLDPA